jgi:hypothetical protein
MVRNLGQARLQKVLSILDRSAGYGTNGRTAGLPGLSGLPGLGHWRESREKSSETPEKRDDSEPDAA